MKLPPGHVAGANGVEPGKVVLATGYGGFGERLLRGMGWDKGQGLGLNGAGIKEAIQVKKKEDTLGVRACLAGRRATSSLLAGQSIWRPARLEAERPACVLRAGGRQGRVQVGGQVVGAGV